MRKLEADVFVVVAFRMMPKVLFEMPKLGTFNLHASLLPDYRGAAPINFAIINGEEKTGATTFFFNEKIDEGNILLQEELPISPDENAGSLHDRLMEMGAKLVVKTLDGLAENSITEQPQPQAPETKAAAGSGRGSDPADRPAPWPAHPNQDPAPYWCLAALSAHMRPAAERRRSVAVPPPAPMPPEPTQPAQRSTPPPAAGGDGQSGLVFGGWRSAPGSTPLRRRGRTTGQRRLTTRWSNQGWTGLQTAAPRSGR